MFSAIQDGEWLEDEQVNDGWDQANFEAPWWFIDIIFSAAIKQSFTLFHFKFCGAMLAKLVFHE